MGLMKIQADQGSATRFRRRVRKIAQVVRSEAEKIVRRASHVGVQRGRELTKEAILAQAGEGNFEFEAVVEEGKWSDIGTHSLRPSYKWVTRRVTIAGKKRTRRFLRRKYPRHIKVFAEKTHHTSQGWVSVIRNRTANIIELNEREHIGDNLERELREYIRGELKHLKRKMV